MSFQSVVCFVYVPAESSLDEGGPILFGHFVQRLVVRLFICPRTIFGEFTANMGFVPDSWKLPSVDLDDFQCAGEIQSVR